MKNNNLKSSLLAILLSSLSVLGQNGTLDNSFFAGGSYIMFNDAQSSAQDMITLADGNILVCGQRNEIAGTSLPFLSKFSAQGTPVANFGTNGVVTFPASTSLFGIDGIRERSDGSLVVLTGEISGSPNVTTLIIKGLNPDGSLIDNFGNGNNTFSIPGNIFSAKLDISPSGKIWVHFNKVNLPNMFTTSSNCYAVQFDNSGVLNTNFGSNGLFTYGEDQADERAYNLTFDENDNAYFGGYFRASFSFGVFSEVLVLKVTSNGLLENSFGNGGVFRYSDPTAFLSFTDIVYRDGFLIGCGRRYSQSTNVQEAMLLKINSQGTTESSFGNSGLVLWDQDNTEFLSMAMDPSGRIVCLGGTTPAGDEDLIVVLFDANGAIQTDFGTAGATLPWDLNGGEDNPISLQLSTDGSGIFVLGYGFSSGSGSVNGVPLSSGGYGFVLKYTLDQSAARVDSKPSSKTISISPNPADDIIRVQSENSFHSYCITDIAGELIEMNNLGLQKNASIEVSHLKAGFYFLAIEFSDKTWHVQKIVVL
jgi:uncharacterized delta-60 repeat protein